jgi:membrane protease YdiL (CAAX protease family)
MDFDRLVFPPAAAAAVISLFYALLHALLPLVRRPPCCWHRSRVPPLAAGCTWIHAGPAAS